MTKVKDGFYHGGIPGGFNNSYILTGDGGYIIPSNENSKQLLSYTKGTGFSWTTSVNNTDEYVKYNNRTTNNKYPLIFSDVAPDSLTDDTTHYVSYNLGAYLNPSSYEIALYTTATNKYPLFSVQNGNGAKTGLYAGSENIGIRHFTPNEWLIAYNYETGNTLLECGNIGIGTSSPTTKLQVNGNGDILKITSISSSKPYACLNYETYSSKKWSVGASDADQFYFYSNTDSKTISYFTNNGNLWVNGGFIKKDSSDNYVLLGGGGHTTLASLSSSHNHDDRYWWTNGLGAYIQTSTGTDSTAYTDLNSYTIPGTYYSANSNVTRRLKNVPVSGAGFKLYVERNYANTYLNQYIIPNPSSSFIYTRGAYYVSNTYTWGDWKIIPKLPLPEDGTRKVLTYSSGKLSWSNDNDANTWRNITVNGTAWKGTATDTGAMNVKNGTSITVSGSNNDLTISHNTLFSSAKASGFYKISYDTQGHITGSTAVTKADITGLGIPGSDTNDKVKQTSSTSSTKFPILTRSSITEASGTAGFSCYNDNVTIQPSSGTIYAKNAYLVNSYSQLTLYSPDYYNVVRYQLGTGYDWAAGTHKDNYFYFWNYGYTVGGVNGATVLSISWDGLISSLSGFRKSGLNNNYVLLAGGGHTTLASLSSSHNHNEKYWALYGGNAMSVSSTTYADLNSYINTGSYYISTTSNVKYTYNYPTSAPKSAFRLYVTASTGTSDQYRRQEVQIFNKMDRWVRWTTTAGTSWSDWYYYFNSYQNMIPGSTNTLDIGSSSVYWRAAYITDIYGTSFSGNAATATNATSANIAKHLPYGYGYDGGKGVTNPYHLVAEAKIENNTSARNITAVFLVISHYTNSRGILYVNGRVDASSSTINSDYTHARWVVKDPDLNPANFILTTKVTANSLICRLYYKIPGTWYHARFRLLDDGSWAASSDNWNLFTSNTNTVDNTYIFTTIPADETQFVSEDVTTSLTVSTIANNTSATFYPTFVDSNNASATAETIYTNKDLYISKSNASYAMVLRHQATGVGGNSCLSRVIVTNSYGQVELMTAEDRGLYDRNKNNWIIAYSYVYGTTFLPHGNVGIGLSAAEYKLHVNGTAGFNNCIWIDRTPAGSAAAGTKLSILYGRMKNAGGTNYGWKSILSMVSTGETGSTVNQLNVELGSQSGSTLITAGEGGTNYPSVKYGDYASLENVIMVADNGIDFIVGAGSLSSSNTTSYIHAARFANNGNLYLYGKTTTPNQERSIIYTVPRATADGGGWAWEPLAINNGVGTDVAHIGVLGDKTDLNYFYIGSYNYNSTQNVRIDSLGYTTAVGFKKYSSSDNYVLLGGGGHALLSNLSSSHSHTWSSITNKIVHSNEFNFVDSAPTSNRVWWNYRLADGSTATSTNKISEYRFGTGELNGALADLYAKNLYIGNIYNNGDAFTGLIGSATKPFSGLHAGTLTLWTPVTHTGSEYYHDFGILAREINKINATGSTPPKIKIWALYAYEGGTGKAGYMPICFGTSEPPNYALFYTGDKNYSGSTYSNYWGINIKDPLAVLHIGGTFRADGRITFTGLDNGTATFTDGTELLTSWASDDGFAATEGPGIVHKRKASLMWNYIANKIKATTLKTGTANTIPYYDTTTSIASSNISYNSSTGVVTTPGAIYVDRTPYGSVQRGELLDILVARSKNAETKNYSWTTIISTLGAGETGTTTNNFSVRFGSTSGATWLSAGEHSTHLQTVYPTMCNTESLFLSSDGYIQFYTGVANDASSYKFAAQFTSAGHFIPGSNGTFNIGSSAESWNNIYAYAIHIMDDGSAHKHIEFNRPGYNYLVGPVNSYIAFNVNNGSAEATSTAIVAADSLRPGKSNTYNLGTSIRYWKTAYITDIYGTSFSGNANTANTANKVSTIANNTNATFYPTFVDSNNASATAETIYTNKDLYISKANASYAIVLRHQATGVDGNSCSSRLIVANSYNQIEMMTANDSGLYHRTKNNWILAYSYANGSTFTGIGNFGVGISNPLEKLDVNGNSYIRGALYLDTQYHGTSYGIHFYNRAYNTWIEYMSNKGKSPGGAAHPAGTVVTTWAMRSIIENAANYGWIWESCSNTAGSAVTNMMELSSNTGVLYTYGGFRKNGSSDNYVLLGGAGHKALSGFAQTNSASVGNSITPVYLASNVVTPVDIYSSQYDGSSDWSSYSWHKAAYINISSTNTDTWFRATVTSGATGLHSGEIYVRLRSGSTIQYDGGQVIWYQANSDLDISKVKMLYFAYTGASASANRLIGELWVQVPGRWKGYSFRVLDGGIRSTGGSPRWTVGPSNTAHGQAALPTTTPYNGTNVALTGTIESSLVTSQISVSIAEKLGTTNKGSATKGIYLLAGSPTEMTYSLASNVNTGVASKLAYYSAVNVVKNTSINTDGTYLANVTYLSVNCNHQTTYRLSVNGSTWLQGAIYGPTGANQFICGRTDNWNYFVFPTAGAICFSHGTSAAAANTVLAITNNTIYSNLATNTVDLGLTSKYFRSAYITNIYGTSFSGNAASATNVTVTNNYTSNADYPVVWSNVANANSSSANQLFKSFTYLSWNAKNHFLTINGAKETLKLNSASDYNVIYYTLTNSYAWSVGSNTSNQFYFWNSSGQSTVTYINYAGNLYAKGGFIKGSSSDKHILTGGGGHIAPPSAAARKVLTYSSGTISWTDDANTNTWRTVKMTQASTTSTLASTDTLTLKNGTGISLSYANGGTITIASTVTNTDTKVNQYIRTGNTTYQLLFTYNSQSAHATGQYAGFSTGLYYNPTTTTLTATYLNGIAYNIAAGGTNTITYQSAPGHTNFVSSPSANTYLKFDGSKFVWATVTDTNTDTLVTQTATTTSSNYPILFKNTNGTSTVTDTARFGAGITVNPSTKTITATTFAGNATTATTGTKIKTNSIANSSTIYYILGQSASDGWTGVSSANVYVGYPYFIANDLYQGSDKNLKKDIKEISDEFTYSLFLSYYNIIKDFTWKKTNKQSTGFIAQELAYIVPDAVNYDQKSYTYSVNYNQALSKMVGALLKKVKEQDERISYLEYIMSYIK